MDAVNHFSDFGLRIGFGAYLIEDETTGSGIVQLIEPSGWNMHRLVFAKFVLFTVMKAFHGALAFDDEESVVRTGMAVHLVVHTWLVAIEGDVTAIRLGRAHVITTSGPAPGCLFFRIDDCRLAEFFLFKPPGGFL